LKGERERERERNIIHVFSIVVACAGGPATQGGVESGEELGHDGIIGSGEG
jgi:hypothetical protein